MACSITPPFFCPTNDFIPASKPEDELKAAPIKPNSPHGDDGYKERQERYNSAVGDSLNTGIYGGLDGSVFTPW